MCRSIERIRRTLPDQRMKGPWLDVSYWIMTSISNCGLWWFGRVFSEKMLYALTNSFSCFLCMFASNAVKRATSRVIQSLCEWNTISNRYDSSIFTVPIKFTTNNKVLQLWFLEAILRSEGIDSMQIQRLLNSPSIFPFLLNISYLDFRSSSTLEYSKQAYNSETLTIRYQRL